MSKPPLPPPPPPVVVVKPKRKSITVQYSEFEEWVRIKQENENWTSVLRRIRMGWQDLKNINITVNGSVGSAPTEPIVGLRKSQRAFNPNANNITDGDNGRLWIIGSRSVSTMERETMAARGR